MFTKSAKLNPVCGVVGPGVCIILLGNTAFCLLGGVVGMKRDLGMAGEGEVARYRRRSAPWVSAAAPGFCGRRM